MKCRYDINVRFIIPFSNQYIPRFAIPGFSGLGLFTYLSMHVQSNRRIDAMPCLAMKILWSTAVCNAMPCFALPLRRGPFSVFFFFFFYRIMIRQGTALRCMQEQLYTANKKKKRTHNLQPEPFCLSMAFMAFLCPDHRVTCSSAPVSHAYGVYSV